MDLRQTRGRLRSGEALAWVLRTRRSGGVLCMVEMARHRSAWELGYVLRRDAWGNGYMTEAVRAILDATGDRRVFARCHAENRGSDRVLRKLGFVRERLLRRTACLPNADPSGRNCWRYTLPE